MLTEAAFVVLTPFLSNAALLAAEGRRLIQVGSLVDKRLVFTGDHCVGDSSVTPACGRRGATPRWVLWCGDPPKGPSFIFPGSGAGPRVRPPTSKTCV
jgi:hypothetical protein